MVKMSTGCLQ